MGANHDFLLNALCALVSDIAEDVKKQKFSKARSRRCHENVKKIGSLCGVGFSESDIREILMED